jgi:hypothetical protein
MLHMKTPTQTVQSALGLSVATLLSAALLAGCQSISANSAQLRIVDAAADAGPLDLYQNGAGLAYNLSLGTLTSYVAMSPGTYTLSADKSGSLQTLAETNTRLIAGKQYTAIVGGGLANLRPTVLQDLSTPAADDQVSIRFVQQAAHSGPVDVYLVASTGRLATSSPIASHLTFGLVAGYLTIAAGTYAIDIVPAGTVPASTTVTLLSGPQQEYPSGAVRTVILLDQPTASGIGPNASPSGVSVVITMDADAP